MSKVLMKGNEAIAEAAVRAGCLNYFAYPITPQSEIGEYLAHRLPEAGACFCRPKARLPWSICFTAPPVAAPGPSHPLQAPT